MFLLEMNSLVYLKSDLWGSRIMQIFVPDRIYISVRDKLAGLPQI